MTRKLFVLEFLLSAAAIVATAILFPHLPDRVATHWNVNGPNGYSPKGMLWLLGPGLLVAIMALTAAMPWLSPKRFEVDGFRSTYRFIMASVFLMYTYIYGVMLWSGLGHKPFSGRAIMGGVCLFIAVIGNVLSKVRPNFYIGVRTPWTLANERVWHATHRFAAKSFVAAGLLGLLLAMAGVARGPMIVLLAGALAPVIYSLVYYKQLERRGEM